MGRQMRKMVRSWCVGIIIPRKLGRKMNYLRWIPHYALKAEKEKTGMKTADSRPAGITVGIPRALTYYEHGRLWRNFFTLLGCSVRVSPETNRRILDNGVKVCSSETCLPVKVMAGHVMELAQSCDTVFIPRYISTGIHAKCCPKLCGLPDMVRMNLKGMADITEIAVDADNGFIKSGLTLHGVSGKIGLPFEKVKPVFDRAVKNELTAGVRARLRADMEVGSLTGEKSIALLGHPYMLYDDFLSMNLEGKLKAAGYGVITPDSIDHCEKIRNARPFDGRRNFYDIGSDILGCAYICGKMKNVAGIIYLTPFACGVDSLTTEFILRDMRDKIPTMVMTVDEHTGEAGFDTRLEAFLDMISRRA